MSFQIHHIVPHAGRIGGYERQARLIGAAQASRGHGVAIVTHHNESPTVAQASRLCEEIPVLPIRKRFTRFDQRDLVRAVENANVLHVHALDPLSAEVVQTARAGHIPAVVKVATQGDALTFSNPQDHPPDVAQPRRFESLRVAHQNKSLKRAWSILRDCEAFIALNDEIRAELITCGIDADRVHRLPNAVELPDKPVKLNPADHSAISVGRLIDRKRLDVIIEALAIVHSTVADATLTLVGDGPDRSLLELRVRDFGLDASVRFTGALDDPTPALRSAGLFILASQKEGCPNALFEAAAAGLPCIATSIAGVTDYFDQSCMSLVEPGNPRALAKHWCKLLTDFDHRKTLAVSARNRIAKVAGVDHILDRYEALYGELVSM